MQSACTSHDHILLTSGSKMGKRTSFPASSWVCQDLIIAQGQSSVVSLEELDTSYIHVHVQVIPFCEIRDFEGIQHSILQVCRHFTSLGSSQFCMLGSCEFRQMNNEENRRNALSMKYMYNQKYLPF